jgi:hypothetical protein
MSNFYEEARRRREKEEQQRLQQQKLAEQQRIQELQKLQVSWQQIHNDLQAIANNAELRQKLEFIRQNIWGGYGQTEPFQGKIVTKEYIGLESLEAGYRLHFDYEVVTCSIQGGYEQIWYHGPINPGSRWVGPESKHLIRIPCSVILQLTALKSGVTGDRYLSFCWDNQYPPEILKGGSFDRNRWSVQIASSNLTAAVQSLDDYLYDYCQTAKSPMQIKAEQELKNREAEKTYRDYKPRLRDKR